MRWLGLLPLYCGLVACDVASVKEAPSAIAQNRCQSNQDCGGTGECDGVRCFTRTPTFSTLLFEITPPDDGSSIAGVQFQQDKDLNTDDPSLNLGLISQVVGKVKAESLKCQPEFKVLTDTRLFSVPALVSLFPTRSTLGLFSPGAQVQSGIVDDSSWGYSLNVPPGTYDIYVQPNRQTDESNCPIPPQLLRGNKIEKGTLSLDIALPEPSLFELRVVWSSDNAATLDGWTVDMLDAASGRVISNRVPLIRGGEKGMGDYVATLSYNPVVVVGAAKPQQVEQLLRLSPPDTLPFDQPAPTVMLARSALGLFAAGSGTLTDFASWPPAVHVHGQVTAGDTPKPAAATVTLAAIKITGLDPGVVASFIRTVDVGTDGKFDTYLLPGTYRVLTVPQSPLETSGSDSLAANFQEQWLVPTTPSEQAGKVIALSNASAIVGHVVDLSNRAVASAPVQAVPSPLSIQSDILKLLLGGSFVPRIATGDVSSTGNFSLKTDPGTFDLSIRPNPDTGFAWFVMPNVPVEGSGYGAGDISMPLPFPYRATVTVDGSEGLRRVPGALVRAYIYMKDGQYTTDAVNADSVLQVAETRADETGTFEALIPATLNHPK